MDQNPTNPPTPNTAVPPPKETRENAPATSSLIEDAAVLQQKNSSAGEKKSSETSTTPTIPAGNKSGTTPPKKPVKPRKLGGGFFLGCFGLFAFLFVLFVILSVVAFNGDPKNSFFSQLGLNPADVKNVLSSLVNISFGFFALILLIVVVINIFRRIIIPKEDKAQKRKTVIAIAISTVVLLITVILWIFVFYSISRISTDAATKIQGDIVVYNAQTNEIMEKTTNLTAPIELLFDASNIKNKVSKGVEVLSYEWDFDGDGKVDRLGGEKERWTYEGKGKTSNVFVVSVKVTARDAKGELKDQTFTKDVSVAYVAPKAVIKADKEQGEAPLVVNFDASESVDLNNQDPKDITFSWDFDSDNKFDDGTTPKITHTFDTIGTYTARVRVENRDKKYTVGEKTITVTKISDDALKPVIQAAPRSGNPPLPVTFSAEDSTSPNGKITRFEWDFGDGSLKDKSSSTTHSFQKAGKYSVKLKIVDEKNKEGVSSIDIDVTGKSYPPVALFKTVPAYKEQSLVKVLEGNVPFTVKFDASSSTDKDNDIVDYQWDLNGDGTFETRGAKPDPYIFYEEGETTVMLKVIDSANNETTEKLLVRVKAKPLEAIIKADPLSGAAPLTVAFDASASRYNNGNITQYQWDFNDGTPPKIYSAQIQYTFGKVGVYKVKLTVFTNDGNKETATQEIVVSEVPVIARFKPTVKSGPAPLNVLFDPSESTGPIAKYFWDFGDGIVSSERKPTHIFNTAGTYTVVLTITSKDNISSQFSEQVIVE